MCHKYDTWSAKVVELNGWNALSLKKDSMTIAPPKGALY